MKIISAFHNYSFMLYFLGHEKPFKFSSNFTKAFPLPQQPTCIFQISLFSLIKIIMVVSLILLWNTGNLSYEDTSQLEGFLKNRVHRLHQ